jgi:DNA end-binding protein Ku
MERVGLAQVVIRTRQYMCAVYPWENALVIHLLRYHAELRAPKLVGIPTGEASSRPRPKEMEMAKQLVGSMALKWEPEDYADDYRRDLLKLIKARSRRGGRPTKVIEKEPAESGAKVLDLVAALERSVAGRKKRPAPVGRRSKKVRTALSRRSA